MINLIDKILLKDFVEFKGSIVELKERIRYKKERNFKLEWISESEFKVLSKLSLGTLILDSNPNCFDGIKGYGKLIELENGNTKIDLKTKIRIELYFVTVIPLLAIIVSFLSNKEVPLWSILLYPIIILWFWFVYRFQEKILFNKVKKYINFELK